jgi:hypothetical protein
MARDTDCMRLAKKQQRLDRQPAQRRCIIEATIEA